MVDLYIDNIPTSVPRNSTVLQACDSLGIDIPRFCFHERLLIAGNCRMCLVEIEKSPKPVASCALPVMGGMKVFTNTPLVKKAQEGVLEFLLLNHPLDCPICDQAGECDLQDQVMIFGSDSSRFYGLKRGVEDKDCGPLIKTIMTRCIHCTRCVRFLSEIAGEPDFGTLGRGTHTQIGTYLVKNLNSELSGNVIDLCPVGALTSKPYAFQGRPWDLKSINSIDLTDNCGSNIVINFKGTEVMRILPRLNENINEEWLSDKARFCYDGLVIQRLPMPLLLNSVSFTTASWEEAFNSFFKNIFKNIFNLDNKLNIIFGKDNDLETILTLKYFFNKFNCYSLYSDSFYDNNSLDFFYKFNIKMKDLKNSDLCILVNTDPRKEASMLNLHLRKAVRSGKLKVGYFGPALNLTYKAEHLGLFNKSFFNLLKGKHYFSKDLRKAKNPRFLINSSIFTNKDLLYINKIINYLGYDSSSINLMSYNASDVNLRELGIKSIYSRELDESSINLYMGTDFKNKKKSNSFSIYCGSHGVSQTDHVDLVLPGKAFSEKRVSFLNLEGLLQHTNKISNTVVDCRNDWEIFNAFFSFLCFKGVSLRYQNIFELKNFFKLEYPFILNINKYSNSLNLDLNIKNLTNIQEDFLYKTRFNDFFNTNILTSLSLLLKSSKKNIKKFNF